MYSGSIGNSYALLNNNDCYNTPSSSSIVSSAPTTPLICNPNNFDSLMPLANNSKTTSSASKTSFDALLAEAYRGLYQPNYSQNLPSVLPNSSGLSPNTSCSSSSTIKQRQTQQVSTTSSNPTHFIDYDQSLDEKRKSIDDQLKKLDNQLLTKVSELTLIQQHHIQLQQQQNRNLKTKNAALIHSSQASSLSFCSKSGVASLNHPGISKTDASNTRIQSDLTNSTQSLMMTFNNVVNGEEQEIFY